MAQPLYPGCDVWLNNPLRPYEACGTSGMKAALNGGLNLSILDGWWDEWYDGNNGWAIPSADGVEDPDRRDDLEADGALRPDRERGRAALLRPRRRRRPDPLARDGPAHAEVARPQGARHPDGPRLRAPALHPGRAHRPRAQLRLRRRRRAGRLEEEGARRAGPASASSTSRAAASATRPRSATTLTVRAFVALGDLSPDDVDVQVVHGADRQRGRARRHHRRARWRSPSPTTAAAPLRRRPSPSTAPAPSATPSGSSRATTCSPRPPSSASSRCPALTRSAADARDSRAWRSRRRPLGSPRRRFSDERSGLAEHDDGLAPSVSRSPALTGVPVGSSGSVESTTSPVCTQSFSGSATSTGVAGRR